MKSLAYKMCIHSWVVWDVSSPLTKTGGCGEGLCLLVLMGAEKGLEYFTGHTGQAEGILWCLLLLMWATPWTYRPFTTSCTDSPCCLFYIPKISGSQCHIPFPVPVVQQSWAGCEHSGLPSFSRDGTRLGVFSSVANTLISNGGCAPFSPSHSYF